MPCNRYSETFLLPCGNIVNKQDAELIKKDKNCTFCQKIHTINEEFYNKNLIDAAKVKEFFSNFTHNFEYLKEMNLNIELSVDNHITYLKEQIELRTESIKIELDKIVDEFCKELDSLKQRLLGQLQSSIKIVNENIEDFEQFHENVSKLLEKPEENAEELKKNVQPILNRNSEIEKLQKRLKNFDKQIDFVDNKTWSPRPDFIGIIEGELLFSKRVKEASITKLELNNDEVGFPNSICTYDDEKLIITDSKTRKINVLNKDFQIVNIIDKIEKTQINPSSICADGDDNIFICDAISNKIFITDRYFKKLKNSFGGYGKSNGEFDNPKDISYNNGCVYVLDSNNYRIQKFSVDGKFKSIINLYKSNDTSNNNKLNCPTKMAIMNDLIAVMDECKYIYIYNFNGKFLEMLDLSNYGYIQSFCFVNDILLLHSAYGWFLCYEKGDNDKFVQYFNRRVLELKEFSEGMVYFNNKLCILLGYEKSLIRC